MNKLKQTLKKCKPIYSSYYFVIQRYKKVKQFFGEKHFAKESFNVISKVQDLIEGGGFHFYFAFGTLLGIIREGRLLKHDMDIDMILYCKNQEEVKECKQYMLQHGLTVEYEFAVDGIGITQHAFLYHKIRIDIHYCFSQETDTIDYVYVLFDDNESANKVARFACPHCNVAEKYDFKGKKINVPKKPIDFLVNMYGENWRTPDKGYKYWESACVDVMEQKGTCINLKK